MSVVTEVVTYLEENSIGTAGTDLFYSYSPDIQGSTVCVLDTGGFEPNSYVAIKNPTFQVFIRSNSYSNGKDKLELIKSLLHQKVNIRLVSNGIYFYYILAATDGGHIGVNENGMHEFTINFKCKIRS